MPVRSILAPSWRVVRYLKTTGRGIVAVQMLHLAGLTNLVDAQKSVRDLA